MRGTYTVKGADGNEISLKNPVVKYVVTDGTGASAHLYKALACSRSASDICYTLDRSVLSTKTSTTFYGFCDFANVAALTNIRLLDLDTNKVLLSDSINCADGNYYYNPYYSTNFSDAVFHLTKGTHHLAIVANIPVARADLDDHTLQVTLDHPSKWTYVRDNITGKKFNTEDKNEVIPGSDVKFSKLTLSIPYIYVGRKAYTKSKLIAGVTDYTIGSYIVSLSNIGNIKLYSPQFKILTSTDGTNLGTTFTKNVVSKVSLYVDGKKVAEDAPDSDGIVIFNGAFANLDAKNANQSTALLTLKADITNDKSQVEKLKALVTAVSYLESDDNYGNAFVLSPEKVDLSYVKGGTSTGKVLLIGIDKVTELTGIEYINSNDIKSNGKLSISANTTDSAYTYRFLLADGQTLNKVMKISLAANYEDFTVNTIKGNVSNGLKDVVDHISLVDGSNVVATTYVRSDGKYEFNNLNYVIKAGNTKDLELSVVIQNGQDAATAGKSGNISLTYVKGI